MGERIRKMFKDKTGSAVPMTVSVVLILLLFLCVISEYFRLYIIASGVRDAVEDEIISTVNDNYAGVYHGAREGYSGSYVPYGNGDWEEELEEGDIYSCLDDTLGTVQRNGRHEKYREDGTLEFAIDDLEVTLRNAPLAPSSRGNTRQFEADATLRLEVPVQFGGGKLPSMFLNLKVQAGYTEVF